MREWIVNLGTRPADQRVAHLLLELLHRLRSVGLATDKDYAFPMSQQMLGIDEAIEPVRVSADDSVSREIYAGSRTKGGLTPLESPSREEAAKWARSIAASCRCAQELREFIYDPES